MKRLLSWLLALVMIISCLPLSALPAFAVETDVDTDFETEEDIIVDFGGELTPIDLTVDLLNEGDFTATVTVPAGKTYHYIAYRVNGMEMTINDGEAVACVTDGMTSPYAWTITNDGADDAEYVIKVSFPAGTLENPAELEINWDNEADIKAGSQGYYYTWTADAAGTLIVTMPEGDWSYVIKNLTTNKHGDQQWSDSDPVVNPAYVTVAENDEIQLIVNNYDPENVYNAPAGVLTFRADLNNEFNGIPVFNDGQTETVTVPAGFTLYYQAFINGMMLTIDGGEPQLIKTADPRMPYVFPLTEGEHTLSIAHPVGTMQNPAQLVIGDNAAQIEAGNTMGYFYNYTVEQDGTLVLDFSTDAIGWTYAVNNLTTGVYGDTQWSDSDPVVNPAEIEVVAGEQLQIIVNTYDPADMWGNPAGKVTVNASYKAEEPTPEYNVAVSGITLDMAAELFIAAKFLIPDELYADENASLTLEFKGDVTTYNLVELKNELGLDSKGRLILKQPIPSPYMDKKLTVTISDGNGNAADFTYSSVDYEGSFSYGIEEYADLAFAQGANYNTTKDAIVALLTYGSYAQVYFKNLPNVSSEPAYNLLTKYGREPIDISAFSLDMIDQVPIDGGDSSMGITVRTGTPNLDASVYMTVQFNAVGLNIDEYDFTLKYTEAASGKNYIIDLDEVDEEGKSNVSWDSRGRFVVKIENISAALFDCMYSVEITNKTTGQTYIGQYSIFAYLKSIIAGYEGNASKVNDLNLYKSMYYYNQAANALFETK